MNNLINQIGDISLFEANTLIRRLCGIVDFFNSDTEKAEFLSNFDIATNTVCEDRASYGDWQTPTLLATNICKTHVTRFGSPNIVVEPTCGLGAFVISALTTFPDLLEIHAIEINPRYTKQLKTNILSYALDHPTLRHPDIYIYNSNFFEFDFSFIMQKCKLNNWNFAIIGNPPWVTNSSLGRSGSNNLPLKRNDYGLKGIDAITGKSNFDISEYITLQLLKQSQFLNGGISFLLKNSVIRNILVKQFSEKIQIGEIEQRVIDASSEFNVSVDASCFSAKFNCPASLTCTEKDFYTGIVLKEYGWCQDAFVSDTKIYENYSRYDGISTYVWRSGIKHDCANVLELSFLNGEYRNGFGEIVQIEDDLIYPLLKSSDISKYQANLIRKFIIVPQRKVGEDTSLLAVTHPLAYSYLTKHRNAFRNRKSAIYKDKDKFSIFGVGDYSFSQYKIVVSSLYKNIAFELISQFEGKPILVDDTCYQLDFDNFEEAKCIYDALNSIEINSLLLSLVFKDAKRVVTKNLLMRLDVARWCKDKGLKTNAQRLINSQTQQLSLFD